MTSERSTPTRAVLISDTLLGGAKMLSDTLLGGAKMLRGLLVTGAQMARGSFKICAVAIEEDAMDIMSLSLPAQFVRV